jgi:hypothetical protein
VALQQLAEPHEELRVCQQEAIGYREQLTECQARENAGISAISFRDKEIAECQAREKVLRELLARYRNETPLGHQPHMIAHLVDTVLALPSDCTALDTLLKAAELKGRRGLLNRLHEVADTIGKNTTSQEARDSIRNLAKELI